MSFLGELFSGVEEGYITLCRFEPGQRLVSSRIQLDQIDARVQQYIDDFRVTLYYNVGVTRTELPSHQRGAKADVAAVTCIWMDIDLPKVDSKKNYPPLEHVMAALGDMPLRYTSLVDTGGGVHVYWFLNEPQLFADAAEAEKFEASLTKPWANLFKVKLAKYGAYDIDSIHDVSRMLRIPGSWHKNGKQCVVAEANYVLRYSPDDFLTYVEEVNIETIVPKFIPKFNSEITGAVDLGKLEALQVNAPVFKKIWDRKTVFPSASECDASIARHALTAGWTDEEIGNLLVAFNKKYTPERLDKLYRAESEYGSYIGRVVAFVRRKAAEAPERQRFSGGPTDGPTLDDDPISEPEDSADPRKVALRKLSTILGGVPVLRWIQVGYENPLYTIVVADPKKNNEIKTIRIGGEAAVVDGPPVFQRRLYSEIQHRIPAQYTTKAEWNNFLVGLAQIVEIVEAPEVTTRSMALAGIRQYLEEKRFGRDKDRDRVLRMGGAYYDEQEAKLYIHLQDLIKHLNMHGGGHKWNIVEMVSAVTNLGFHRESLNYEIDGKRSTKSYWCKDASDFKDILG